MTSFEPDGDQVNLPGIGSSLDVADANGRRFTIVRRNDGAVEMYLAGTQFAEFEGPKARALGTFISGHYLARPDLAERLSEVVGGLSLDWMIVERHWASVGKSIEQLAVRRTTGVTIVAILRGRVPIVAPEPTTVIAAGDELVVACRQQDLSHFTRYMASGR